MNFFIKDLKLYNAKSYSESILENWIYPHILVFSNNSFAPSICSSSTAHVPASYPDEAPTSAISAIRSELPSRAYIPMPILLNTSTDTNLPPGNPPDDSAYQSNSQWLEFAQATHSNTNFSPQS